MFVKLKKGPFSCICGHCWANWAGSFEVASTDTAPSAPCTHSSANRPARAHPHGCQVGFIESTFSHSQLSGGQSNLPVQPRFKDWEYGHIANGVDSRKGGKLVCFFLCVCVIYCTHTHINMDHIQSRLTHTCVIA